jgi:hypothetical protein
MYIVFTLLAFANVSPDVHCFYLGLKLTIFRIALRRITCVLRLHRYVFRLLAENPSGRNIGPILGPITTVEHAPEMLDKSGWMTIMPKVTAGKGRRLSLKSSKKVRV